MNNARARGAGANAYRPLNAPLARKFWKALCQKQSRISPTTTHSLRGTTLQNNGGCYDAFNGKYPLERREDIFSSIHGCRRRIQQCPPMKAHPQSAAETPRASFCLYEHIPASLGLFEPPLASSRLHREPRSRTPVRNNKSHLPRQ